MGDEHGAHATARSVQGRDASLIIRFLVIAAIVVALVLVGLDNRDDVRVGYVIGDRQGPIWVVMLVAAVAGVLIGWLIKHRPHRH